MIITLWGKDKGFNLPATEMSLFTQAKEQLKDLGSFMQNGGAVFFSFDCQPILVFSNKGLKNAYIFIRLRFFSTKGLFSHYLLLLENIDVPNQTIHLQITICSLDEIVSELNRKRNHLNDERSMKMNQRIVWMSLIVLTVMVAGPVLAQEVIVYPAKGQSQDQMEQDKFQCYTWAKNETGFDPMQIPTATAPPPQKQARKGGAGRGAVGGAAAGAAIGGIARGRKGAGRGALIGAGSGALIGGMRRENQRKQEEQARNKWEREQTSAYMQKRNTYNRAYSACLEGRGYTVK